MYKNVNKNQKLSRQMIKMVKVAARGLTSITACCTMKTQQLKISQHLVKMFNVGTFE